MDQPTPGQESKSTPSSSSPPSSSPPLSFNSTILFNCGPATADLTKKASALLAKLATSSCHMGFLKACRDHHFIPKGLRLSNPINSTRSSTILNKASFLLLNERLKHYRSSFATTDRVYKDSLSRLLPLLPTPLRNDFINLCAKKSASTHFSLMTKHSKKFTNLLELYSSPTLNPYSLLRDFYITEPLISGPLKTTTPTSPALDPSNTVINLSSTPLSHAETEVLSLGLKFAPTPVTDPIPRLAPLLQSATRKL